jgi:hypothetical protein
MMEQVIRVLTTDFWVAASDFLAILILASMGYGLQLGEVGLRIVSGLSIGVVLICSGAIAGHEFWKNPIGETEGGMDGAAALLCDRLRYKRPSGPLLRSDDVLFLSFIRRRHRARA